MLPCNVAVFTCVLLCAWELNCLHKIGMSGVDTYLPYTFVEIAILLSDLFFFFSPTPFWAHHQCTKIGKKWVSNRAAKASVMCRPWLCLYISITNRILPGLLLCHSLVAQCPGMPCCAFFSLPPEIRMLHVTVDSSLLWGIKNYTLHSCCHHRNRFHQLTASQEQPSLVQASQCDLLWGRTELCNGECFVESCFVPLCRSGGGLSFCILKRTLRKRIADELASISLLQWEENVKVCK